MKLNESKYSNFAVFILTHGRPNNVKTINTLRKSGYTGKIYLILDNEDDTLKQYEENYGKENIIVFDKADIETRLDRGDNFDKRGAIIFARNASFEIARDLGLDYFWELDDDYTSFQYRLVRDRQALIGINMTKLDEIIPVYLEWLDNTNMKSVAFAQGGDFIGGVGGDMVKGKYLKRKAMNSFFCKTDRPFKFMGFLNEDVNIYTSLGNRGDLFYTVPPCSLNQLTTQKNTGGMTDIYQLSGTYVKSFYSVIFAPYAVRIGVTGNTDMRIHHTITWKHAVPKVIRREYKKNDSRC